MGRPFRAWRFLVGRVPRALPWAVFVHPVGVWIPNHPTRTCPFMNIGSSQSRRVVSSWFWCWRCLRWQWCGLSSLHSRQADGVDGGFSINCSGVLPLTWRIHGWVGCGAGLANSIKADFDVANRLICSVRSSGHCQSRCLEYRP